MFVIKFQVFDNTLTSKNYPIFKPAKQQTVQKTLVIRSQHL